MTERQDRSIHAYQTACDAIDALPGKLSNELRRLRDDLRETLNEISRITVERGVRGGPTLGAVRFEVETMREKQMIPLARLTRRLFVDDAQMTKALRVPHKRASTDDLLESAIVMMKALRPHRRFLARNGVEPARLDHLADAVRRAKHRAGTAERLYRTRGVTSTKLAPLLARARRCVDAVDAIVVATLPGDEVVRWRSTSRVGKRMGRPPKRAAERRSAAAVRA